MRRELQFHGGLRLPKDRAFGDVQFDVAFQQDVGRDIAFAVKRAVAVEHDPSAPLRGSVVAWEQRGKGCNDSGS